PAGKQAEGEKPPSDPIVVDQRGFERWKVSGINACKSKAKCASSVVADLKPHGLNAATGQGHSEEPFAFRVVKYCGTDSQLIIPRHDRPFHKAPFLGLRPVRDAEPAGRQNARNTHRYYPGAARLSRLSHSANRRSVRKPSKSGCTFNRSGYCERTSYIFW